MTTEEKKKHILRCTILGMDLYSACICSECTQDEVEQIEQDEAFSRRLAYELKKQELSLLTDHDNARSIALQKGNTSATEWMLEHLNPDRWGKTVQPISIDEIPKVMVLMGKAPDGNSDS